MIDVGNNKWATYRYKIETIINTPSTKYTLQDVQIARLYIERDFDNDHLPIILMDLLLPEDWYWDIKQNALNTSFTVTINKYAKTDSDSSEINKSNYITDKFIPILKDNTPFIDQSMYNTIKYGSGHGTNKQNSEIIPTDLKKSYTFILVRQKDLLNTKNIVNKVLSSSNIQTAVGLCLMESGVNKVLMSPIDNKFNNIELLLLPLPLISQLKYINSFYGLYKEGAQIFFDLDCVYILRNSAKCTAWRKNELKTVTFVISEVGSENNITQGIIANKEKGTVFMNINTEEIEILNLASSSDHIIGNNSIIFNNIEGTSEEIKSNASQVGSGSFNLKTVTSHNPYIQNELSLRTKELSCVVNIACQGLDVSYLTPNKEYKLVTDVTNMIDKIKGEFRLSKVITVFKKEGDYFIPNTSIQLRKTT